MKATGIVRRIDDLGRIVIPKEIRRTLRIRNGDPLEIFTEGNGEVVFRKYSPMGETISLAEQYAEAIAKHTKFPVVICDRDRSVAAAGIPKKDVLDRAVSHQLEVLLESRKSYIVTADSKPFFPFESSDQTAAVVFPIISAGDLYGSVIMLECADGSMPTETDIGLASVAATFFGKQSE